MNPIAFKIFSFPIRWYGIMAALGLCAAYLMIKKNRDYAKLSDDNVADIVFLLIVSGIIGARVFYVVEYFDQFRYVWKGGVKTALTVPEMFIEMLKIYNGGIVFYGGFIFAVVALIIYCRKKKFDFFKIADICVPGVALGHAFGRVGCFLNGCCFGKTTTMPLSISYPPETLPSITYPDTAHASVIKLQEGFQTVYPSLHLHPVQLYESCGNIIIALILNYTLRKFHRGQNVGLYFLLYGILRFSDEFARGDYRPVDMFGIFTPGQFVSLFLIPAGIAILVYFNKSRKEAVE